MTTYNNCIWYNCFLICHSEGLRRLKSERCWALLIEQLNSWAEYRSATAIFDWLLLKVQHCREKMRFQPLFDSKSKQTFWSIETRIKIWAFKWVIRTSVRLIHLRVGGACSGLWELTNKSRLGFLCVCGGGTLKETGTRKWSVQAAGE